MWRLTLITLLFSFSVFAQSDTNTRQIEISGAGYKLYRVLYSQVSVGVNFPAKKDNWYNNLALSVNIQDATKRDGAIFSLYSLSVGKSYQRMNNHFFGTLGFNTGLFYGVFTADQFVIRHMGINGIPKAEIGYNMKKTVYRQVSIFQWVLVIGLNTNSGSSWNIQKQTTMLGLQVLLICT